MPKKYITLGVLLVLGIFMLIVGSWALTRPKAYLQLETAPREITVTYGNTKKTVMSGEKITMQPGTYAMTLSAEGFKSVERSVTVTEDETSTLYVALLPTTDAARSAVDTAEAKKIREQQKALEKEKFMSLLPITSANFSIVAVPALLHPGTERRDILINVKKEGGEAEARANIASFEFDFDTDEILVGENDQYLIATSDDYSVKALFEKSSPTAPLIYITPKNVPYVPRSAPYNEQLESLKNRALDQLRSLGYPVDKYDIYYDNIYLSKYSPTKHDEATHGTAAP